MGNPFRQIVLTHPPVKFFSTKGLRNQSKIMDDALLYCVTLQLGGLNGAMLQDEDDQMNSNNLSGKVKVKTEPEPEMEYISENTLESGPEITKNDVTPLQPGVHKSLMTVVCTKCQMEFQSRKSASTHQG